MEKISFAQMGVAVAIAILSIHPILALLTFFGMGGRQKREVSFTEDYATRAEVKAVDLRVQNVDGKVEALKTEIVRNGEIRKQAIEAKVEAARSETQEAAAKLNDKIERNNREIGEVNTKCDAMDQQLCAMDTKLTRLLERGGK